MQLFRSRKPPEFIYSAPYILSAQDYQRHIPTNFQTINNDLFRSLYIGESRAFDVEKDDEKVFGDKADNEQAKKILSEKLGIEEHSLFLTPFFDGIGLYMIAMTPYNHLERALFQISPDLQISIDSQETNGNGRFSLTFSEDKKRLTGTLKLIANFGEHLRAEKPHHIELTITITIDSAETGITRKTAVKCNFSSDPKLLEAVKHLEFFKEAEKKNPKTKVDDLIRECIQQAINLEGPLEIKDNKTTRRGKDKLLAKNKIRDCLAQFKQESLNPKNNQITFDSYRFYDNFSDLIKNLETASTHEVIFSKSVWLKNLQEMMSAILKANIKDLHEHSPEYQDLVKRLTDIKETPKNLDEIFLQLHNFLCENLFDILGKLQLKTPSSAPLSTTQPETTNHLAIEQKNFRQLTSHAQSFYELAIQEFKSSQPDSQKALEWLKQSAEQEYTPAMVDLGVCYDEGRIERRDFNEAFRLFKLAAKQGDARALVRLGICYEEGRKNIVEKDLKQAINCYKQAIDKGNVRALSCLGNCYEKGLGVKEDLKEAVKLYQLAAEKEDARAQARLAVFYLKGWGGLQPNYQEALRLCKLGVEKGDSEAQAMLGAYYRNAFEKIMSPPKVNYEEAFMHYQLSAAQGDPLGLQGIGMCYMLALGTKENIDKAIRFLYMAVAQGNSQAFKSFHKLFKTYPNKVLHLGMGYEKNKDFESAVMLYRMLSESKETTASIQKAQARAQAHLGICYENGWGVEKNLDEAERLYQLAANQKDARGQFRLAFFYAITCPNSLNNPGFPRVIEYLRSAAAQDDPEALAGLGAVYHGVFAQANYLKNKNKAFECYKKSADQDHPLGLRGVGICYFLGFGVEKDMSLALTFLKKAISQGDKPIFKGDQSAEYYLRLLSPDKYQQEQSFVVEEKNSATNRYSFLASALPVRPASPDTVYSHFPLTSSIIISDDDESHKKSCLIM